MRHFNSRRQFLVSALGVAAAAALRAEEPKIVVPEYNKMSDEDEIKLGKEAAESIEKEGKLSFIQDPEIQKYVEALFAKIIKTSRRPNLPYTIKIVDTKEVNAFALPGGPVYLNRGLMQWARSESELAGVLSHEIGHVVGRHGANSYSRMKTADSLLDEFAKRIPIAGDATKILAPLGTPLAYMVLMKYSRDQELEADLLGFYNMQRAGWDPQGIVDLFKHFGEKSNGADDMLATVIGSHPAPADREAQITSEMKKFPPQAGLTKDTDAFKGVQAKLKAMPAPKITTKLVK